jgi:hypothetical protein
MANDDDQMWKPSDMEKSVTVGQLFELAKKLRSRAYWMHDDHYTSEMDGARNAAIKEALEGFAEELDSTFGFDSVLTSDERRQR